MPKSRVAIYREEDGSPLPAAAVLLKKTRKTECGAKQFLICMAVRAAPFALLNGSGDGPVLPPGGVFQAPTGQSSEIDAIVGSQSAEVLSAVPASPFVWRIDVRLPQNLGPSASAGAAPISLGETNLQDGFYIPAGPFNWNFSYGLAGDVIPSPNPFVVWVQPWTALAWGREFFAILGEPFKTTA